MTYAAARTSFHPVGFLAATTALVAVFTAFSNSTKENRPDDLVPSKTGTYWIYRGATLEATGQPDELLKTEIERKITVLASATPVDKSFVALLLKSHTDERNLSTNKTKAEDDYSVALVFRNHHYYRNYQYEERSPMETWDFLKRTIAANKPVSEPSRSEENMHLPCQVGTQWGSVADTPRDDGFYCWNVEKIDDLPKGSEVAHFRLPQNANEYTIAFRTLPDEQINKFVPGIGFTSLVYSHHGTVIESKEQLIDFHPGSP